MSMIFSASYFMYDSVDDRTFISLISLTSFVFNPYNEDIYIKSYIQVSVLYGFATFSEHLEKEGDTIMNPIKNVQPIRNQQQLEDMKWALKRHCSERDYILFVLGCETGLRVGDLLRLKPKQILNLKGKYTKILRIKEGKTQKIREMYLENCFQEVYCYAVNVDSEWLFPSRKGDGAITPTQAYRQLNKAADFAGVDHVGNHTLRKTFGYWFYKATKDIAMLQGILHHSDPSITLRYIGITEEETNNVLKTFSVFK
jgi:integrase